MSFSNDFLLPGKLQSEFETTSNTVAVTWIRLNKKKNKQVKSHDRISGPRFINSFRKCSMEQNMHGKKVLCHSKSYFMSLEKQVGVYISTLLSVLF